ncbi:MAG: 7-cyano-7-deazaguanine synthase QueC [Planctomycetota bacterium]|jgi:7-cyano-7-deazaguanine synthase|nr:7-cyano-7-deazaguanine synthase QueC [Planctomycetota bacterium]
MENKHAVILLSGGLDSATILAVAKSEDYQCHCLSFDYGQRNRHELDAAGRVARGAASHTVMPIHLDRFGGSALTGDAAVPKNNHDDGIPVTYVPARNTIFLSYALALAEVKNAEAIFIGVNSIDYSGYPDCRAEYIAAFQKLANLATKRGVEGAAVTIRAPLQNLTKSGIITWGASLGVDYSLTLTCYDPVGGEGLACGECDACRLRRRGFKEAGVADPTRYAGE